VASAAAILAGLLLALFSTSGPAVAFFSGGLFLDVQVEEPATLVARGAAVDVPVEVTCNATGTVYLYVTVTQRSGSGVASGTGFAEVACSGSGQRIVVRVSASPSGRAFKQGTAVVTAELFGCRPTICGSETDTETITLQR
jgi:hypothetical protein